MVEETFDQSQRLLVALAAALPAEDVAHRADEARPRRRRLRRFQQRQQFETHLAPPKGIELQHQHAWRGGTPGFQQGCAARALPCFVDGTSSLVQQHFEAEIRSARRRQLNETNARARDSGHRGPAAGKRDRQALHSKSPRKHGCPLQVTDPEQVLNVEEDAGCAQRTPAGAAIRASNGCSRATAASRLRSPATNAAAALPRLPRLPASSSSSRTRPASAASSPPGASRPVRPSSTTSGTPRVAQETTGTPAACASSIAMP